MSLESQLELAEHSDPEGLTSLSLGFDFTLLNDHFEDTARIDRVNASRVELLSAAITLQHHFPKGWSGYLSLPAGSVSLSSQDDGASTQRLSGLSDIRVGGGFDFAQLWGRTEGLPSLMLRLGLTLPTGEQDTLGVSESGAGQPVIVQPGLDPTLLGIGTGAFGGRADLSLWWPVHPLVSVNANAMVVAPFTRSPSGGLYAGPNVNLSVGAVVHPLRCLSLGLRVLGNIRGRANAEEAGTILNSGGEALSFAGSVGVTLSDSVRLGLRGRLPLLQRVNGEQLGQSFSLGVSLSVTLSKPEAQSESTSETSTTKRPSAGLGSGDVQDLAQGGSSFVLSDAVVPGKLTVIDYWAPWCGICKVLGRALERLASKETRLAIRKVEVPDFDSPVAVEHLKDISQLPVVWLMAPGQSTPTVLVGTDPDEVLAEIKDALTYLPVQAEENE